MYPYRYRRFGWLPLLLLFFVAMLLFSGGFHHPWFFFGPLFLCFPFIIGAGLFALFAARRWHGDWPRHRSDGSYRHEKPKHSGNSDSDSDIFYV